MWPMSLRRNSVPATRRLRLIKHCTCEGPLLRFKEISPMAAVFRLRAISRDAGYSGLLLQTSKPWRRG